MTNVDVMPIHLAAETLAAFADGRLRGGERDEVISHLVDCDDCRAIFDLVTDAQEEGVIETERHPVVVHGNFGRRAGVTALLATAAAVAVVFLTPASREWIEWKRTGGIPDLVETTGTLRERRVAGRLDGFSYKRLKETKRSGGETGLDLEQWRVEAAASEILRWKPRSAREFRAHGLAHLLMGNHDQAIAALQRAVQASGDEDPVLLNDLAAAHLQADDYAAALRAAESSLAIKRTPEAAWNRALAIEYARRYAEAIKAWEEFIALDPQSPWAAEAAGHIEKLRELR